MTSNLTTKGIRLALAILGAGILIGYQNCGDIKFSRLETTSASVSSVLDFDLQVPVSAATNESLSFIVTNVHFNSGNHDNSANEIVTWTAVGASQAIGNPGIMSFANPGNYIVNVTVEKDGEVAEKQFSLQIVDETNLCSYSDFRDSDFICDVMASGNLQVISHASCYVRIRETASMLPRIKYTFDYSVDIAHGDVVDHEGPLPQNPDASLDYDLRQTALYTFAVEIRKESCANTVVLHHEISTGGDVCPRGQICAPAQHEWQCLCNQPGGIAAPPVLTCVDSSNQTAVSSDLCSGQAPPDCGTNLCEYAP